MHAVYLSLGSNLGHRHATLLRAIDLLTHRVGPLIRASSFIQTEPWGFASPHPFLNACVLLHTHFEPFALLEETQAIERQLGRTEKTAPVPSAAGTLPRYADRPIDIDILLYDDLHLQTPRLTIPHPLMQQRPFVMRPLQEIL